MQERQLIGTHPVIGIRRIIEARRGVLKIREGIEDKVMSMAQEVKKLYAENLKYDDGTPVDVVISDVSISCAKEAAICTEQFKKAGVSITLSVTSCWCYGSETMDMDPMTIKGIWGFNGTESPGAVYLASVLAVHAQKGLPVFTIYGKDVQNKDETEIPEDVAEKLLSFARSAIAVKSIYGKSYLQIGAMCMGIGGSLINPEFIEKYLGMRVESVSDVEILRRIEKKIYNQEEYEKALAWTKKNCAEGFDKNPDIVRHTREQKDKEWEFTIKTMLIIKDLMRGNPNLPDQFEEEKNGHNAIAAGFQGQRQWTDIFTNTDFSEAMLNSSFDWDGPREPYILATENDVLNSVCMLIMKELTGRAQLFADVRTYWSEKAVKESTQWELTGKAKEAGGFIHLINSGSGCIDASGAVVENGEPVMKRWYDMSDEDCRRLIENVTWNPTDLGGFCGGGFSSRFVTRAQMPVTMIRINLIDGEPVMQIAEGWTVNLPEEVNEILWKRTDYTWPCTWFTPRCDGIPGSCFESAYSVMNSWGANHGAISYGHIGADIITTCSMLRIPVCLHNVDKSRIFRPASWKAFGMDYEGADFRACKHYGSLY